MNDEDLQAIVDLFELAGRLKTLKRQGWIDRGVDQPESVADHTFRLALMAMIMSSRDSELDSERCVRLALIHDLPETIVGDITPFDGRLASETDARDVIFTEMPEWEADADREKTDAERAAIQQITSELPEDLRTLISDAWEEYEAGISAEARFVRQLDKLETWLQAVEYQERTSDLIIESFRKGTERDVTDQRLRRVLEAISARNSVDPR
jgi:putative hydrolases of HD superfamily